MTPRNGLVVLVACLAGIAAALFVYTTPFVTTTVVEQQGTAIETGRSFDLTSIAFLVLQSVAAITSVAAAWLVWKGHLGMAKRLLVVAIVAGLVPAVVPGAMALLARYLIVRYQPAT
ncbi:hypothetical protein AB0J90_28525 [Micromonospora sp. NPDC049523]|uniref:hypothetical protein n=1 Tax=Micromonospora sp. NPDC049523 TaxID=3155921 RepID=UPI00342BCA27